MRYVPFALIALAAAGCSDPVTSNLAVGQRVILIPADPNGSKTTVDLPDGTFTGVAAGTRATVVSDDDTSADPPSIRIVRIRISEGPRADLVGTTSRQFLRPAP